MPQFRTIELEELKKISFLDYSALGGRVVPPLSCLNDKGQWEMWLPGPNGLVNIQGVPVVADYFAKQPEKDTDIYFDFINVMTKHAYWPDLVFFIDGIRHDLHNLGASLAKLDLFYEISKEGKPVSLFVATETEYIFTVCRSIFDLLQEVISGLWERVQLYDQTIHKHNLPKTFKKMVMRDNVIMSIEQIKNQHQIPETLSIFYHQAAPFFEKLRAFRDEIVHSGKGFELIFETEHGFAVRRDAEPFSMFDVWKEEDVLPNNLASLRSLIAFVIYETLTTCDRYADALKRTILLPPDIAPEYRIFIRGYHIEQLLRLEKIMKEEPWWK